MLFDLWGRLPACTGNTSHPTAENLENITVYLRKNLLRVELVIVSSLIAVARKIIILDFKKTSGMDLLGLANARSLFSCQLVTVFVVPTLQNQIK